MFMGHFDPLVLMIFLIQYILIFFFLLLFEIVMLWNYNAYVAGDGDASRENYVATESVSSCMLHLDSCF